MLPLHTAIDIIDSFLGTPISEIPEESLDLIQEAQYTELWYSAAFHYCPVCGKEA